MGENPKSHELLIGMHVSASGSLDNSVLNAKSLGCNAFQIFTRNPRGWTSPPLYAKEVDSFRRQLKTNEMESCPIFAHMPYPPNFSSPEKISFKKSTLSLIDEAKRCSKLGIPYLVAHLGSHKGAGSVKGIDTVTKAFYKAAKETPDNVTILLENNSGGRDSVGSNFEELADIFSQLESLERFGICFDTCHAFTAGYDMHTPLLASKTWDKFVNLVRIENIKLIHLNDSRREIGSGADIHEHVGLGHIGKEGLSYFVKVAKSHNIPLILETPIDERCNDAENLKVVRDLI
jgi:deoxyribonuclease IV